MTDDQHLNELARQCANATAFSQLNHTEQLAVFSWLLDGGHMTRTGKALQRPRQQPAPISYDVDGQPIFAKGADHATHETVVMPGAKSNG